MPIKKASIKANKQNKVRKARNQHFKSRMKTLIKKFILRSKDKSQPSDKDLSQVYSSIDTCLKKNIIKKNNAARKKSKVAKLLTKSK